jgi:hypothetical protein
MLHWWGEKTTSAAMLVRWLKKSDGIVRLEPINLYHTNENGGLWMPKLSHADIKYIQGLSGSLQEKNGLFEGKWTHTSGEEGNIILSPSNRSDSVVPEICSNWDEFKVWANEVRQKNDALIFRVVGAITSHSEQP